MPRRAISGCRATTDWAMRSLLLRQPTTGSGIPRCARTRRENAWKISSWSGASIELPTSPPGKAREDVARVRAVFAFRAKRRALQERVGRLQRARFARRDQQTDRVHAEEVEQVVAIVRAEVDDDHVAVQVGELPDQRQPLVAQAEAERPPNQPRRPPAADSATDAGSERVSAAPVRPGGRASVPATACNPPSGDFTPNSVCWRGDRKSRSTTTTRRPKSGDRRRQVGDDDALADARAAAAPTAITVRHQPGVERRVPPPRRQHPDTAERSGGRWTTCVPPSRFGAGVRTLLGFPPG